MIRSKAANKQYQDGWDNIFKPDAAPITQEQLSAIKQAAEERSKVIIEDLLEESSAQAIRDAKTVEWHKFCETNNKKLAIMPTFTEWENGQISWK